MGSQKDISNSGTQEHSFIDAEMLKFASVRVPLAVGVGLFPIIISSLLYVSTFSIATQTLLGGLTGLLGMFSFQLFQVHRSSGRRRKTTQIAQLASLTQNEVKTLIPEVLSFPSWESFPEYDKVNWLNKALDDLWPSLDKAVSEMLKEQIQPILDQYAMGLIKKFVLQNLTLGSKAPRFEGIKVSEGAEDETVLETMFQWIPENENLVLKIDSTGPDFKVKVKDIHVSGILKFIFKPLQATVPCFGAVLVSFTEPPDVDFNLKFLGGSLDALPGVEKLIDDSIRTALMDTMVWPCRIVVPMFPGDWSNLELHPIAELDLTLIEIQDIMKTDIIGKSDPFCMFYVRQKADKIQRSSTKKNKKSAVWNESFVVEVEDREVQVLTIRLMDEESLEKAQYIGSAEIPIMNLESGVTQDMWVDMLENPHDKSKSTARGKVHLTIKYRPLPTSDPTTSDPTKPTTSDPTKPTTSDPPKGSVTKQPSDEPASENGGKEEVSPSQDPSTVPSTT